MCANFFLENETKELLLRKASFPLKGECKDMTLILFAQAKSKY